jgi:hypothetical protein
MEIGMHTIEHKAHKCWNLIKYPLTPFIPPVFYSWIGIGASNMVSEPGGLEFEPRPCIFRCA